jgi:hypothetical protein
MTMRAKGWKYIASVFVAGLLAFPVAAAPRIPTPNVSKTAEIGTINYIEGQATLNGQALNQNSIGTVMPAGATLATGNGRAELLLTPGVILRLDNGSAVLLNSPDLANTLLTMTQGRALVEVDNILPANNLIITEGGVGVKLVKKGLYEFDATSGQVRAFEGQAKVMNANKSYDIDGGHELALNQPKLKVRGFDKKAYENTDFYRWSSLRASYLAEANASVAREYVNGGPGWYGAGWYWSPWYDAYTWIPGDGIWWGPFGWGFFSPWYVGYAPFYFGYGYGFPGYYHHFGPAYHAPMVAGRPFAAPNGFANRGFAGGGFHGGFAGGGFHGGFGGGGFHGGGYGGGRR